MPAQPQSAGPSRRVLDFIEAHESQLVAFTRDLVATPSPTPPGDERAVAARIIQELAALHLGQPEIIARAPERPNLLLRRRRRLQPPVKAPARQQRLPPRRRKPQWRRSRWCSLRLRPRLRRIGAGLLAYLALWFGACVIGLAVPLGFGSWPLRGMRLPEAGLAALLLVVAALPHVALTTLSRLRRAA